MPEDSTIGNDSAIEVLNLSEVAKTAAYLLKTAHPSIIFTSGRRDKQGQATAMAGNVVRNRKWIEETYVANDASRACQNWVDQNPDKIIERDIARGLKSVLDSLGPQQLAQLSKHLTGDAFDVQPVEQDAAAIIDTIKNLPGLSKFLSREGGLIRWHAQF
jgi:hypothetical protein